MRTLRQFCCWSLLLLLPLTGFAPPLLPDRAEIEDLLATRDDSTLRFNIALLERFQDNPTAALGHARIAARHAPWDGEIRALRDELLRELRQPVPSGLSGGIERLVWTLPAPILLWSALAFFWIALAAIAIPRARRKSPPTPAIAVLMIVSLLAGAFLFAQHRQSASGTIVATESIPLRSTPAAAAPEISWLVPGESARLLATRGEYLQVRTRRNEIGWINASQWIGQYTKN